MSVTTPDRTVAVDIEVNGHRWRVNKIDFGATVAAAVTASRQVIGGGNCYALAGWTVAETTATAVASFRLHDGNGTAGESLGRRNLAANESVTDWLIPHGVRVFTGRVYLEIISGSVEGVLYFVEYGDE